MTALHFFAGALQTHPELALLLTLGAGYLLGQLRFGPVALNPVIGVILAGLLIGQLDIEIPAALQAAFLLLFLFSVGFRTGPQFFQSLARGALPQVMLTVLLGVTALVTAYAAAHLFGLGSGTAAGLLGGSLTAAPAVGTAIDSVGKLAIAEPLRQALRSDITVAFAVTYLAGLLTALLVLVHVGPWLMRVNLRAACQDLESKLGVQRREAGTISAYREFVARCYRVPEHLHHKAVAELEQGFAPENVYVERLRNSVGELLDADPDQRLSAGDVVVITGRARTFADSRNPLQRHEVDDPELADIPATSVEYVLRRKDLVHRTLADIVATLGGRVGTRGVFVRKIMRGGAELPLGPNTVLERGDLLTVVGTARQISRLTDKLGPAKRPSDASDIGVLGTAIAIGGLVGLPALRVAGLEVGLSLPVGVLLGGLVAGWVHSTRPLFGRFPEPALWLLDSLGLTMFLAAVALGAGPSFVHGLRTTGPTLLILGVLVSSMAYIVTILVGYYVLRMHPGIVLGVCAGGGTCTPALAALQESAASRVPAIGYGVSYAVGSVLLALAGTVVIALG